MKLASEIAAELRERDDWQHTSEISGYRLMIYWSDYYGGYRAVIRRGEAWQWELTMKDRDALIRIGEEKLIVKARRSRAASRSRSG